MERRKEEQPKLAHRIQDYNEQQMSCYYIQRIKVQIFNLEHRTDFTVK